MNAVTELTLPILPVESPEFSANPTPYVEAARRAHPWLARLHASVASAFTPRQANQIRPLMQQVISDLLDEWAPQGEFDFAVFSSYFPVAVICGVLGASAKAIPKIRAALENQLTSLTLDPAAKPLFMAGWEVLWSFADQLEEGLHLIAQRLRNPKLAGKIVWRPFLGAWGLKTFPIEFELPSTKAEP